MIGQTLSHFRILEKLGEGGMGLVYRAEDERLRRQVALKTLRPEALGDEQRRRRLLREARSAAAVTHPNIATIYEVDEVDGTVFIAMELVSGETLRSRLAGGRPLPLDEVLRIAEQLAAGLSRAHEARLVHRDLKPENIVISGDGQVKILDFGLAKAIEDERRADASRLPASGGTAEQAVDTPTAPLTGEGAVLGTVAYMSPEQVRGRDLDGRSDLFSLGTVVYEMLTGRPPFVAPSSIATVSAILEERPPLLAGLRAEVPAELARIVDQLLIKEPAARYPSAHTLALALGDLRASPPSSALGLVARQQKLCVCGRSQELPLCDGSHRSDEWTCAEEGSAARFGFCAARRYHNLARKLASHYGGVTCLEGEECQGAETWVVIVDGTDLDYVLDASREVEPGRRLVVTLGVGAELLAGLFPGSRIADLSDVQPLYAFKRLSALLDAGDVAEPAPERKILRSTFISHAVLDEPLILPVKTFLEHTYGADVFTCADSIPPGTDWQAEIMNALRDRACFVYALSEASLASHFCSFEVGVASALGKPIHLISLDGSRPPVFIQHLQTVDLERIARTRPWLERHDLLLEELLKILGS